MQFKCLASILLYCTCLLFSGLWTCILAAIASATQGRHILSEKHWVHLETTHKAKRRCLGNTDFSRCDQLGDHKLQRSVCVFFPYFDELADKIAHCLNKFGKNNDYYNNWFIALINSTPSISSHTSFRKTLLFIQIRGQMGYWGEKKSSFSFHFTKRVIRIITRSRNRFIKPVIPSVKFAELVDCCILQIMFKAHKGTLPSNIPKKIRKKKRPLSFKRQRGL